MKALGDRGARRRTAPVLPSRLPAVLLVSALAAGCDDTVQPLHEDENAVFSMVGYLDLMADTQWVRVMPIRETLFLGPDPIDAVVTLEHLGSGRVVTLNDSLFAFSGGPLDGVAHVHNFWTTEPLEAEASYRLRAARSDGASSTAVVVMPPELEMLFLDHGSNRRRGPPLGRLHVRAERVLFLEILYTVGTPSTDGRDILPATPVAAGAHWTFTSGVPGTQGIGVNADSLPRPDLVDMFRWEIRIVTGRSDWPYHPGLSDPAVTLPSTMPSNVENGLGFVGGVATRRIPFDYCDPLEALPDGGPSCTTRFDTRSASIAGRVIEAPCGEPHAIAAVRLTERFAGGGSVIRAWKTGWGGEYRFDGIEPDAELFLEVGSEAPVQLPPLAPGERYTVDDILVEAGC